jgi:hypothetical protein
MKERRLNTLEKELLSTAVRRIDEGADVSSINEVSAYKKYLEVTGAGNKKISESNSFESRLNLWGHIFSYKGNALIATAAGVIVGVVLTSAIPVLMNKPLEGGNQAEILRSSSELVLVVDDIHKPILKWQKKLNDKGVSSSVTFNKNGDANLIFEKNAVSDQVLISESMDISNSQYYVIVFRKK